MRVIRNYNWVISSIFGALELLGPVFPQQINLPLI